MTEITSSCGGSEDCGSPRCVYHVGLRIVTGKTNVKESLKLSELVDAQIMFESDYAAMETMKQQMHEENTLPFAYPNQEHKENADEANKKLELLLSLVRQSKEEQKDYVLELAKSKQKI